MGKRRDPGYSFIRESHTKNSLIHRLLLGLTTLFYEQPVVEPQLVQT